MSIELITIRELLRDPQYRAFFSKVPVLPEHYTPENKVWKLFISKPGENIWRSKRFGTYKEAFEGMKKMLPVIDNAAINCTALGFMPPLRTVRVKGKINPKTKKQLIKTIVWTPRVMGDMEHHDWCCYCRRPTIFRYAVTKMKVASNGFVVPASEPMLRCMICGASDQIVNLRNPIDTQHWDPNRPKVY